MVQKMIQSPEDVARLVNERGFLPFFFAGISGFSLEEVTPPEYWFPDDTVAGVWEWKGQVIIEGDCAYGKFFQQKACFISMDIFPDFANYRRSRYPLTENEAAVLSVLKEHHSLLSKELKKLCGYSAQRKPRVANPLVRQHGKEVAIPEKREKQSRPNFDTVITRLQMGGHVVTADFEYMYDKNGKRYGWGVARYCTPEDFFGPERMQTGRTPEQSRKVFGDFIKSKYPRFDDVVVDHILGAV